MMKREEWKHIWLQEEQHAFQGWDFSYLESRWRSEPLDWDYKSTVMESLRPTDRLLDMGTGGGEFLLSLGHPYENTAVTEGWRPNIELCMERLAPLGIRVCPVREGAPLPLADGSFDMVINRHESYDPREVRRVLKPGGRFLTQQVGGEDCVDLMRRVNLAMPVQQEFSMDTELTRLQQCGFSVHTARECFPRLEFFDVGAIVFWARIIEWSFPDFSVERNFDKLCALQEEMEEHGVVCGRQHRFLIAAQKGVSRGGAVACRVYETPI